MKETLNSLIKKINKEEEISPFLFVSKNLEILNEEISWFWLNLLKEFNIPNIYLYILKDNWEKIKVKEVRDFIKKSESKSWYKIQIFFIENISRLTTQASNSLLKFFEEPWIWNIILCTNKWESNVLDTILSRVQTINIKLKKTDSVDNYLQNIIDKYIKNQSNELIKYMFSSKKEKDDYLSFLENLLLYMMNNFSKIWFLNELNQDINLIKSNNLNPKYFSDKWILKIK